MERKTTLQIIQVNKYEYRQKNKKKLEIEMGRKTTVEIFQVTNINIDRKTMKNMKLKWKEKKLYRYFK